MGDAVEAFWRAYLASLPEGTPVPASFQVWSFGDSPALADELAALVVMGRKTATCGALYAYQVDGEPLPQVGGLSIITDGQGQPQCVIETIEVTITPFNRVDAAFAYEEGEDDRTLESWRRAHWTFFTRESAALGYELSEEMPLVCERFRMIYLPEGKGQT
ncbi:MAG: ASCH domain-containing protein [Anaerolineae bacterium]